MGSTESTESIETNNLNDNSDLEADTSENTTGSTNDDSTVEIKNPAALMNAYERTKKLLAENKAEFNKINAALGGMTPEEISKLRENYLLNKNKFTEVLEEKNATITDLTHQLQSATDKINTQLLNHEIEKAFYEAEGKSGHFVALQSEIAKYARIEDDKLVIVDESGHVPLDSELKQRLTPAQVISKLFKESSVWGSHFNNDRIVGTGANSSISSGTGLTRSHFASIDDPAARIALARQNGIVN